MSGQMTFDFETIRPPQPSAKMLKEEAAIQAEDIRARDAAHHRKAADEARAYWQTGMVTSLPCFATVLDSEQRYTQMLPGVIEAIADDKASVRIYAAPEYGYTIDNYPLHGKLAVNVPLADLCALHGNHELERLVEEGRLENGDAELGQRTRERANYQRWP